MNRNYNMIIKLKKYLHTLITNKPIAWNQLHKTASQIKKRSLQIKNSYH